MEFLAISIRQERNIKGVKIKGEEKKNSQYADDTGLTLMHSVETIKTLIQILNDFYNISGLKANYDKSKIMLIGAIEDNYAILMPETGIEWTNDPLCILWIYIGTNKSTLKQLNYSPVKTKITNLLNI